VSQLDWVIVLLSGLLELAVFLALLRKHRFRYCYSFLAYLGAQLLVTVAGFFSPAVYEDWKIWLYKEAAYALLRIALVAEIVSLIFRVVPRARNRAVFLLMVNAIVLVVALLWPYDLRSDYTLAKDLISRMSYDTVCVLLALLGLVSWHRLPLHHLHKSILHGMLWLLLAHFGGVYAAAWWGEDPAWRAYHAVQAFVYLAWLRAAWTVDPALGGDEAAVIRYLQPWRAP
jgi:hypothetical protein